MKSFRVAERCTSVFIYFVSHLFLQLWCQTYFLLLYTVSFCVHMSVFLLFQSADEESSVHASDRQGNTGKQLQISYKYA